MDVRIIKNTATMMISRMIPQNAAPVIRQRALINSIIFLVCIKPRRRLTAGRIGLLFFDDHELRAEFFDFDKFLVDDGVPY